MTMLFKRHFQTAYVVDDIEQAMAVFASNYGITQWDVMDMVAMAGPGQPLLFIANAWAGDMMIELMQPDENVTSIYTGWQKQSGATFRLHHLGFLVDSDAQMAAHKQLLERNGHPIVAEGSFGDVLDFAYADTTSALGHFYELIHLKSQGKAFFDRIPVN